MTRTVSGQASSIGYFFDPAQDFVIGESGVLRRHFDVSTEKVKP